MRNDDPPGGGVAIIGMSGRFPGARTLDQFWANLCDGVNSISFLTRETLEQEGIDETTISNPNYVRASPHLEDVDKFDARLFAYSPREAALIDPQQRLLLECAWEALEHAGYLSDSHPYPVGIYAGSSFNTYLLHCGLHARLPTDFVLTLSSSDKDFLATRIAYKLNLQGPAITVQTACSTSLVAVHLAIQSLLIGECDLALAGGVCVKVPHRAGYFWQEGSIVSRDGHVRAFDANASGTVFGSGAGLVVLKRFADAKRDGDFIHAVIRGSAVNNDGSTKASFTAPSVDKQAEVVVEALANAGVPPGTIGYVEAHGTGTALGDPIEIAALTKAFRTGAAGTGSCAIGSVKTNVGHTEAAAGVIGLIKAVLALQREAIPPNVDFTAPNPAIDFEHSPFFVARELLSWRRTAAPRRAGVSALGAGGTNVHVVLEEGPVRETSGASRRPLHLLPLSARTRTALDIVRQRLRQQFESDTTIDIADAAFTLQTGRRRLDHRAFVVCGSGGELVEALRHEPPVRQSRQRGERIVFVFPDAVTAGRRHLSVLCASEPVFREQMDRCRTAVRLLIPDIESGFWIDDGAAPGSAEHVLRTFAVQYALARLWIAFGALPAAVVGDGLGEFAAACIAGLLPLDETIAAVAARAGLIPADRTRSAALPRSGPPTPCLSASTGMPVNLAEFTNISPPSEDEAVPRTYPDSLRALLDQPRIFLQVGAGGALPRLLATVLSDAGGHVTVASMLPISDGPDEPTRHLLTTVGELWAAGVDVDFQRLHEGEQRRRIPLPTYPFEGQRYWWGDEKP